MTYPLRDQIARIITLDHLQLLSDFDVDGDLYRLDPECRDGAYATADAILAALVETAVQIAENVAQSYDDQKRDPRRDTYLLDQKADTARRIARDIRTALNPEAK